MSINNRLARLRQEMVALKLDAYIIPSSDPHLSEYLAEHWQSRRWLSGFTGSSGTCVITATKAGLWTDSRYFIQAKNELSGSEIILFKQGEKDVPTLGKWLKENITADGVIGFDGGVCSLKIVETLRSNFKSTNIKLNSKYDLIDKIWEERPKLPNSPIFLHKQIYSGQSIGEKLSAVREKMKNAGVTHYLVTALDEVAWLFNFRGNDIHCNPVAFSYALISESNAILFIDGNKVPATVKQHFSEYKIRLMAYKDIFTEISKLKKNDYIFYNPNKCNYKLFSKIPTSCKQKRGTTPITILKSSKNSVEQQGMQLAHINDGVAMVKFLYWLDCNLGKTTITELTISEKLQQFRSEQPLAIGNSFDTIAAYADHGAIVHYSATQESAYTLEKKGFLLVDSGGQYLNGTTDITRTIALGKLSYEEQTDYTLVLKGHIDLAMAIFPEGTKGYQLDTLARLPLWESCQNFQHGTGHGVGMFLNVHEGPHGISPHANNFPIALGTVTSNEPGIYKEGRHGVRIENIILAEEHSKGEFGKFLCFKTITFCPYDTRPILRELLTIKEISWLNNYHKRVYEKLSPLLPNAEKEWLYNKTQPLEHYEQR